METMTAAEFLAAYLAGRRDFRGVDLGGANLIDLVDLVDTYRVRANLEGANLRGADLTGADMHSAGGRRHARQSRRRRPR